ncbi:MAG: GNAT family protein [Actinoplanes sp.]
MDPRSERVDVPAPDSTSSPWPLADVRVTVGRWELRLPDDRELGELARSVADECIPSVPALSNPADTPAERTRRFMQDHWRTRAEWQPGSWALDLFAFDNGRPVGQQRLRGEHFALLREVATGSLVRPDRRGSGVGTAMRAAILSLAFDGLGAEFAQTGAVADNPASLTVTAKYGYEPNGVRRMIAFGTALEAHMFQLSAARWRSVGNRPAVEITGLTGLEGLFGADGPPETARGGEPQE